MGAQVDFYILEEKTAQEVALFTSKLTQKAFDQDLLTIILAEDSLLTCVSQSLWASHSDRFLPHERIMPFDHPASLSCPPLIRLSTQLTSLLQPDHDAALLINFLHNENAPNLTQIASFARIAEIVIATEKNKIAARHRYRRYQQAGFVLKTHQIP